MVLHRISFQKGGQTTPLGLRRPTQAFAVLAASFSICASYARSVVTCEGFAPVRLER
jgi:hypothetical protein